MRTIITILALVWSFGALGQTFTAGTFVYKSIGKGNVAVAAADKHMSGNVAIPQNVRFGDTLYNVTAIADTGFMNCSGIRSIILPSKVNRIGRRAFLNCLNLNSVNIPYSVKRIPEGAFCHCEQLPGITLPDGITEIGAYAFAGCKNITRIIVPDNCKKIGIKAFYNCAKMQALVIPALVESIGERCLHGCPALVRIEVDADNQHYVAVDGVLLTKDMKRLIKYPGRKTTQTYDIPQGVVSVDEYAFENVEDLCMVRFPASVTKIGNLAFVSCPKLLSANYPPSLKEVGEDSFLGCSNLQESDLPGAVTFTEYDYDKYTIDGLE